MNSKVTGSGDDAVVQKTSFLPKTATFEPRHENKSCSAFPEDEVKSF